MGFWSKFWGLLGFGGDDDADRFESPGSGNFDSDNDAPLEDNGLPSGWHFYGIVENDGSHRHVDDSVTDQEIRDADRVFIAKTFPDGNTRYRQFSSANSKDAIGDMLIRESGEGSPI